MVDVRESRTIAALATLIGASIEAPAGTDLSAVVEGLEMVERAGARDLTFVGNNKYARKLETSRALVAVVSNDVTLTDAARARTILRVKNADIAMIAILESFAPSELFPDVGIDASARVHPTAVIGVGARIGAFVSVGKDAVIGARTVLFDGVRIYHGSRVGDDCVLHANVVVRERCTIGHRVILASGVAIGTDGFGYRPSADGKGISKIPHIGTVSIEDDVELGANTCVDRGKFGATRVGAGTKIDNVCQIGHNVEIGRCVVISGLTGIAGSTRVGDGCRIGGGVGIADHLVIGRGASLAARSGVLSDVPDGVTWGGVPAQDFRKTLREYALIRKLPEWHQLLKPLLSQLSEATTDLPKAP